MKKLRNPTKAGHPEALRQRCIARLLSGEHAHDVAASEGVSDVSLYNWRRKHMAKFPDLPFPGSKCPEKSWVTERRERLIESLLDGLNVKQAAESEGVSRQTVHTLLNDTELGRKALAVTLKARVAARQEAAGASSHARLLARRAPEPPTDAERPTAPPAPSTDAYEAEAMIVENILRGSS